MNYKKRLLLWIAAIIFGIIAVFLFVKTQPCACNKLTPTPTPQRVTPTPQQPTPTPVRRITPILTPVPQSDPDDCGAEARCAGGANPPVCVAEPLREAPIVTKAWRDGNGNLDVEWTDVENWGYVIYYTPTGNVDWLWNVVGVGEPPYQVHDVWQMVDIKICALNVCHAELCSDRYIDP